MSIINFFKESPFVQKVRYYKRTLTNGTLIQDYNEQEIEVYNQLVELNKRIMEFDYCKNVRETVYLEFSDFENIKLILDVQNGDITFIDNFDQAVYPTSHLKIKKENLDYLQEYLKKGYLTPEEKQSLFHFLAIPTLESFYYSKLINKLKTVAFLKLHKLIHMTVLNPNGFCFADGSLIETKATVINVHGQFIILEGHHGVAPVLFEVSVDEALEYYNLLAQELPNAKTLNEKRELYTKYLNLRNKTVKKNPRYENKD